MALDFGIPNLFPTSRDSDLGTQEKPKATFTKDYFIPVNNPDAFKGNFAVRDITAGNAANMSIGVPSDFTTFKKVYLIVTADTGHNDWAMAIETHRASEGEDYDSNFASVNLTPDLQTKNMEEVDISELFLNARASDYMGIGIENNQVNSDTLSWIGIRVIYE